MSTKYSAYTVFASHICACFGLHYALFLFPIFCLLVLLIVLTATTCDIVSPLSAVCIHVPLYTFPNSPIRDQL